MTQKLIDNVLYWVRTQEKKLAKTPVNEIDPRAVELIADVKFYALKKERELRKVEINN